LFGPTRPGSHDYKTLTRHFPNDAREGVQPSRSLDDDLFVDARAGPAFAKFSPSVARSVVKPLVDSVSPCPDQLVAPHAWQLAAAS
jgi:hypothetical protein